MGKLEFPLLTADQIEVKVKQVTAKGVVLLLYKTARTDMDLLDAMVGPLCWQDDYREIKGNLYCGIGITEDGLHWVWKWDCGIESRADGEGNEKKGEASDAFKRSGFRWGIGRELYTSPFIFVKCDTVKNERGKYEMKERFTRFSVKEIGYTGRTVSRLVIVDEKGAVAFSYGKGKSPAQGDSEPLRAICADCGGEIRNAKKGDKVYTAEEAVNMSKEIFWRPLCWKCLGKALNGHADNGENQ